jgi:hypothetical protein
MHIPYQEKWKNAACRLSTQYNRKAKRITFIVFSLSFFTSEQYQIKTCNWIKIQIKKIQVAFRQIKTPHLSILENHHSGCRFILLYFLSNKAIKNAMYRASDEASVDHNARPSFRNKTLFDLCTAALLRGTSNVFMGFLASFCAMVLGLESIAFTSLVLLSRNSSRPYNMHCIKLRSPG